MLTRAIPDNGLHSAAIMPAIQYDRLSQQQMSFLFVTAAEIRCAPVK